MILPQIVAVATILGWGASLVSAIGCGGTSLRPIARSSAVAAPFAAVAPPAIPSAPLSSSAPEAAVVRAPRPLGAALTWSALYSAYMAPGTEGGCGRSSRCHARQMADAASAYGWLQQRGYIAGTGSALASNANSCLGWFGGNMPPGGHANAKAAADVAAWVAAGALEN
jgi:hypothetical protein